MTSFMTRLDLKAPGHMVWAVVREKISRKKGDSSSFMRWSKSEYGERKCKWWDNSPTVQTLSLVLTWQHSVDGLMLLKHNMPLTTWAAEEAVGRERYDPQLSCKNIDFRSVKAKSWANLYWMWILVEADNLIFSEGLFPTSKLYCFKITLVWLQLKTCRNNSSVLLLGTRSFWDACTIQMWFL